MKYYFGGLTLEGRGTIPVAHLLMTREPCFISNMFVLVAQTDRQLGDVRVEDCRLL